MRERLTIAAILILFPLVVFLPVLEYPFTNYDDLQYIVQNPQIDPETDVSAELLFTPNLGYPMPVPVWVYRLARGSGDPEPGLFHGLNLTVHVLGGLLVWLFLSLLIGSRRALLGALVWCVHPLVVEPVSWCAALKDCLTTAFSLVSLICFRRAREQGTTGSAAGAAVTGVLAILSKPVAVVLPVLMALDLLCLRGERRRPLAGVLALVSLVAAASMISSALLSSHAGGEILYKTTLDRGFLTGEYFSAIFQGIGLHASNFLAPWGLSAVYFPEAGTLRAWLLLAAGLCVAAAWVTGVVLLWRRWVRDRRAGASPKGEALFLLVGVGVAYAPVSQVVPMVHFAADSYVYFPLVFLIGFFVRWIPEVRLSGRALRLPLAIGLVAAMALGWTSTHQHRIWSSSTALWGRAVERYPGMAFPILGAIRAHRFEGDVDGAADLAVEHIESLDEAGFLDDLVLQLYTSRAPAGDVLDRYRSLYGRHSDAQTLTDLQHLNFLEFALSHRRLLDGRDWENVRAALLPVTVFVAKHDDLERLVFLHSLAEGQGWIREADTILYLMTDVGRAVLRER